MRWLALCCTPEAPDGDRDALGWLALGFTPRVARLEEAVVAEVSASLRLFRGARALRERLQAEAAGLALGAVAWAPTALGALALARCPERPGRGRWNEGPGRGRLTEQPGQGGSSGRPAKGRPNERLGQGQPNEEPGQLPLSEPPPQRWLSEHLDALPLAALSAAHAHHAMLARLGCRHLGTLRRLPRAALAKRFGPALLTALDQAYGDLPEVHDWLTLPERFDARLELPYRVEHAPVLLHFAEALLRQLGIFLAARHAGVRALRLGWQHDAMRPRDVADSGELSIATADTTRDVQRLSRLLGEHLARTELAAPAGEIRLSADTLLPLHDLPVAGLLPGASGDAQERLTANALLERLSVRLGAERVREGRLHEDHRLEHMQRWHPWPAPPAAAAAATPALAARRPPGPQPTWLVEPPQPLRSDAREQPLYAGALTRVSGPHRVEAGWWDGAAHTRDYFVYRSAARGLLWVYRERLPVAAASGPGWFLHGVFA